MPALCFHTAEHSAAHTAQDFHARYYHPSNARIWFYGDDEPEERLRILSTFLDEFDAREVCCWPVFKCATSLPASASCPPSSMSLMPARCFLVNMLTP